MGKDTIVSRLLARDPTLVLSRSWTTRPPRPTETADAYNFVDRDTFMAKVASNGFLEWAEYLGNLYGTPVPEPAPGTDVILVIEVQGAQQVLDRVPGALMILIVPPSREAQAARLRARGDSEEWVAKRLTSGVEEEAIGRRIAHEVVVNADLDRAVDEVAAILARHRNRSGET
ncbi:MAG: guanylate kinase [Actinobacteria bacterium]|nr:guanylate kinase [Actinomycetota bacterium]MBV9933342.1 guanylate kinase [Actinomycetota bacterium]